MKSSPSRHVSVTCIGFWVLVMGCASPGALSTSEEAQRRGERLGRDASHQATRHASEISLACASNREVLSTADQPTVGAENVSCAYDCTLKIQRWCLAHASDHGCVHLGAPCPGYQSSGSTPPPQIMPEEQRRLACMTDHTRRGVCVIVDLDEERAREELAGSINEAMSGVIISSGEGGTGVGAFEPDEVEDMREGFEGAVGRTPALLEASCLYDSSSARYRVCHHVGTEGTCHDFGESCLEPGTTDTERTPCLYDDSDERHKLCHHINIDGSCAHFGEWCDAEQIKSQQGSERPCLYDASTQRRRVCVQLGADGSCTMFGNWCSE